jgi:DNA-binding transcriptional ArsR family regulator
MALIDPGAKFPEIDRIVHEPARLAILTVLSSCKAADFLFLQSATGLSKGNLSVQLSRLEETGLIKIRKEIVDKKTRTTASLSTRGRQDLEAYWILMDLVRAGFIP